MLSLFFAGCSVDNEDLQVQESLKTMDAEFNTTATACPGDIHVQICNTQINNPTVQGFTNFYKNQIFFNTNFTTITGTFSPTMAELVDQYNQSGGIGTFTTYYTVETAECGVVTMEVAVEVLETKAANAGEIANIPAICTTSGVINLESLLSPDATRGGTFTVTPGALTADGNFDPAIGAGEYTIVYTVDSRVKCVTGEDTASFTVKVNEGFVRASDIYKQLCSSQIGNPTLQGFTNYYKNQVILNTNLPMGGTFNPSMSVLLNQYQQAGGIGTFTTNYTVDTPCGVVTIEIAVEVNNCNS